MTRKRALKWMQPEELRRISLAWVLQPLLLRQPKGRSHPLLSMRRMLLRMLMQKESN